MPTYEYECLDCKEHFDIFQSIMAEPIKNCPKCSGKTKRLISAGAGIIFKGSGFYATDYKKGRNREESCPLKKDKSDSCKSCPKAED